jgi:hypothetical protein
MHHLDRKNPSGFGDVIEEVQQDLVIEHLFKAI